MKKLEISLLGSPVFREMGKLIDGFNSNKTRALLCYLAATGQQFTRPKLAGLFWRDMPEARAQANLRKSLTNLRKLVGDYLEITRQAVGVRETAVIWLDVAEFQTLTEVPENIENLKKGLTLYRDDFLEGFHLNDAPEFENWMLSERARLRERVIHSLYAIVARSQVEQAINEAITYAQQLLTMEPWREETYRTLMTLYASEGQLAAAAKTYALCQQAMEEELGVEPAPETQQLHQRIQQTHTQFLHNIAPLTTPIIGRDDALTTLEERLATPEIRLITIVGMGGMGKTYLAQAFAQRLVQQKGGARYWEGIYFVSLTAVSQQNQLIHAIASALNIPLTEKAKQTAQ